MDELKARDHFSRAFPLCRPLRERTQETKMAKRRQAS
jgi:hypothetical protein